MPNRVAIFLVCLVVVLAGSTATAQADSSTQLPFTTSNGAWLAVDPSGGHVFVSGGPGTSSIVVLNFAGQIVKTIAGQGGASQLAVDTATHTLYAALHDQTAISEIDTQKLTETKRFSTAPYPDPSSLVIAGGKIWFSCFQNDGEGCHGLVSADLDGSNMAVAGAPVANWFFATTLTAGGPGNKYLAAADTYQEPPDVDVYDVSGASPTLVSHIHNPDGGTGFVNDMAFDPTGANLLLTAGAPYYVESLSTSTLLSSGQYPTGPYPISVAITADGKFVAGGIDTNNGPDLFVYPVGNETPVRTWQVGADNLSGIDHGLAFSPDAKELFAVAADSATGHLAFHVLSSPTVALTATTTSLARVTPSSGTVKYGSPASLKVQVTGAPSGKIDLYATPSGGTKTLLTTGTLSSGAASFNVQPRQNTTYSAVLEQGTTYASSTSLDVSVDVAPLVSVSTRNRGKTRVHGIRVSKIQLNAKVNPARPSEPVVFAVQRRAHRRWRADVSGQVPTASNGTARVYFVTNRHAEFRVRVQYAGDSNYATSKSAWKTFRVR
jgi:hypothetical protein